MHVKPPMYVNGSWEVCCRHRVGPSNFAERCASLFRAQLFKVEPTAQQMLYCPPGQDKDIPELLEEDTKSLAELGVVSGGTIVVDVVH